LAIETKKKMSDKMVQETKEIFQSEMVQKLVNWSNKPEEKIDTKKREQILQEKVEKLEEQIKPILDIFEKENPTKTVDKLNPDEVLNINAFSDIPFLIIQLELIYDSLVR
jgi:hypothetical protein